MSDPASAAALSPASDNTCWHCGEKVTRPFLARTPDGDRPACCAGCAAAIETIHGLGLDSYYQFRGDQRPRPPEPGDDVQLALFSIDALLAPFFTEENGHSVLTLSIDGLHCAACVWLIEKALGELPGVNEVRLNLANGRLRLRWQGPLTPREVAARLLQLGYTPQLPLRQAQEAEDVRQDRLLLVRLLIAGLGAMQAMMYATALYVGAFDGMEPVYRDFFRVAGLVVASPVVFFCGWPFISGAWRAMLQRHLTMDVPVAIALLTGWIDSLWATLAGGNHVYFESLSMFVFFLLASRWIERRQRRRVGRHLLQLQQSLPLVVRRFDQDEINLVPVAVVEAGDRLQIRQGESVPVDARVLSGQGRAEQAVLTGEPLPLACTPGMTLAAGSRLTEGLLEIEATGRAAESMLARIGELVEQAQAARNEAGVRLERLASRFVAIVLALSAVTLLLHWPSGAVHALETALAVLVVTCPCALALAAPLTLAAAVGRGLDAGVLVASPQALLDSTRARTLVFDKTGTLTSGHFFVESIALVDPAAASAGQDLADFRSVVAGLERFSPHPLSQPLQSLGEAVNMTEVDVFPGGVSGRWQGHQWQVSAPAPADEDEADTSSRVTLFRDGAPVMHIRLADPIRPESKAVCEALGADRQLLLASGDAPGAVAAVASALSLDGCRARLSPRDKQVWIQSLQQGGEPVMMVGDGINDAPALLEAQVSLAVADSPALARQAAGIYLLRPDLDGILQTLALGRLTRRILRQNIGWALGYNLVAIPFAMAGLVPPWLAAIGMSASSLLVTVNAARLLRNP